MLVAEGGVDIGRFLENTIHWIFLSFISSTICCTTKWFLEMAAYVIDAVCDVLMLIVYRTMSSAYWATWEFSCGGKDVV